MLTAVTNEIVNILNSRKDQLLLIKSDTINITINN